MAAGTWLVYGLAKERISEGAINLASDTFKCLLLGTGYSVSINADDDLADITANEIGDAGYARVTLTSVTNTHSAGVVTWDAADISFGTAVSIAAKRAVIYDDTHASDALICVLDLNTAGTASVAQSVSGNFKITIDAAGILTIS